MTIFGVDIHPGYQAGFPIEALPGAGMVFLSVKVSEGTNSSFMEAGALDWIRRGHRAGLLCMGYHYLRPGAEQQQAKVFCDALRRANVPGVLDAEAIDGAGRPTLSISGIRTFLDHCRRNGARVPLLYLPKWYWERMGRPSLSGLPMLWASSYPSKTVGNAATLYQAVGANRWAAYGNNPVAILQFAETGAVAGRSPIDLNAFHGTRDQLQSILMGDDDMPSAADVWNYPVADPYVAPDGTKAVPKSAADLLAWSATHAAYAKEQAVTARAEIAGLRLVVTELAGAVADIDADDLLARMDTKIREALAEGLLAVDITVRDRAGDQT